jgi:short-subunit dehydrogenase
LITGASAGIGAALARVFAQHGFELALVARREDRLAALADALADAGPRRPNVRPHVLPFDLQAEHAIEQLAAALAERGLRPSIVVNNAGYGLLGAAVELSRARQLAMIDLNVRVLTDLSLRWIDGMAPPHEGIINLSSIAGFLPGPGMAVYHACKAYVLSFSEALHRELKPRGVKVTVACPGPVRTEFQELGGIAPDRLPRRFARSAERVAHDTYAGFMAGRRVVIPGFANKVVAALPHFLSRARMLALVEAHQRGLAAHD